jgi:hypothetical protein
VQEAYERYADGDPEMMMTEMATLHLTQTNAERPLTTTMGGQRVEQLVDEFATRTKIIKTPMPKELMPGSTVVGAGTVVTGIQYIEWNEGRLTVSCQWVLTGKRVAAPFKSVLQPDYTASERAFLGGTDHPSGGRFARRMQSTDPLVADELLEEGRAKRAAAASGQGQAAADSNTTVKDDGSGGVRVSVELPPMGVSAPPIDAEAYLSVGYLASAGGMGFGGLGASSRLRSDSRDQLLTVYREEDDDDEDIADDVEFSSGSAAKYRQRSRRQSAETRQASSGSNSSNSSNSSDEFTNLRTSHTPSQAPLRTPIGGIEDFTTLHSDLFEPSGVDIESTFEFSVICG